MVEGLPRVFLPDGRELVDPRGGPDHRPPANAPPGRAAA